MKIKRTLILMLIFLLTIGIVTAVDISNLNMPDDFESTGGGLYRQVDTWTNGGTGFNAGIYEYSDSSFQDWTNDDVDYTVNKTGDLYWFVDGTDEGVIEVVELDGSKYIVVFYATSLADGGVDQAYLYMMEFNDLNNVKPIAV